MCINRAAYRHLTCTIALVNAPRGSPSLGAKDALVVAKARGVKLGNLNGAATLRRAGKSGVALRTTIVANADQHAADLAEWLQTSAQEERQACWIW